MQAGPILTRDVRAAIAAMRVSDSIRGLAMIWSPTQTWAKPGTASAAAAMSRISAGVVSPSTTPRLERVSPIRAPAAIAFLHLDRRPDAALTRGLDAGGVMPSVVPAAREGCNRSAGSWTAVAL